MKERLVFFWKKKPDRAKKRQMNAKAKKTNRSFSEVVTKQKVGKC